MTTQGQAMLTGDDHAALPITVSVNGRARALTVAAEAVLVDVLHQRCGLHGTRVGCDAGVCGACTVLVDGRPTAACSTFAFEVDGRRVLTVEGLAGADGLHPLQRQFIEREAFQCGYCTPGMVLAACALLAEHPDPDEAQVRAALAGNTCRCTGYRVIVEAVQEAAAELRAVAEDRS